MMRLPCPSCHAPLRTQHIDRTEDTDPKPGDYGICNECLAIFEFNADCKPIIKTDEELAALPLGQQLFLMMAHMALSQALERKRERAALQ